MARWNGGRQGGVRDLRGEEDPLKEGGGGSTWRSGDDELIRIKQRVGIGRVVSAGGGNRGPRALDLSIAFCFTPGKRNHRVWKQEMVASYHCPDVVCQFFFNVKHAQSLRTHKPTILFFNTRKAVSRVFFLFCWRLC